VTGSEHRIRANAVSHAYLVDHVLNETSVLSCNGEKLDPVSHKSSYEWLKIFMRPTGAMEYDLRQMWHYAVSDK
jgi:hypothetical protein